MTPENAVEIIAALTGVIAVIVSLVTASGAAKQSAFTQLEKVVKELRTSLNEEKAARKTLQDDLNEEKEARRDMEAELKKEQKRRDRIERWAHALANQLIENHIKPVALSDIE
jgi:septal ring factor EnvC (AmiA/AmiB activator)